MLITNEKQLLLAAFHCLAEKLKGPEREADPSSLFTAEALAHVSYTRLCRGA
jgi:hypothetical protein